MSWLAIGDGRRQLRSPNGEFSAEDALVSSGSIVIETLCDPCPTPGTETGADQILVEMQRTDRWRRRFAITLAADGRIVIEHRQGTSLARVAARRPRPDHESVVRLTYAWNAPGRLGLLSVETAGGGWPDQVAFDDPLPWPWEDFATLTRPSAACRLDPSVTAIACSDKVEPVGTRCGMAQGTIVGTEAGPRPVETLRPGDRVITAGHGLQPVRWRVSREVPAVGGFAPVRLYAPFFGLQRDICLAGDHKLLISGADAEYLFGSDAVLVEAGHLARMTRQRREQRYETVTYHQIILDRHDCLWLSGAWGESMYLGDIADHPARLATSALAAIPANRLPRHSRAARPVLSAHEAAALASALCA